MAPESPPFFLAALRRILSEKSSLVSVFAKRLTLKKSLYVFLFLFRPGGMKFEKAKEWRVPVVNVQWLSDLVLGQMDALRLPVQMRYLQVGHARDFYADLSRVWQWMSTYLYFSGVFFFFPCPVLRSND